MVPIIMVINIINQPANVIIKTGKQNIALVGKFVNKAHLEVLKS